MWSNLQDEKKTFRCINAIRPRYGKRNEYQSGTSASQHTRNLVVNKKIENGRTKTDRNKVKYRRNKHKVQGVEVPRKILKWVERNTRRYKTENNEQQTGNNPQPATYDVTLPNQCRTHTEFLMDVLQE